MPGPPHLPGLVSQRHGAALGASGVLGAISSRTTELEDDLGQVTYGHSASSRAQRDAAGDSSAAGAEQGNIGRQALCALLPSGPGESSLRCPAGHGHQLPAAPGPAHRMLSGTPRAVDGRFYKPSAIKVPQQCDFLRFKIILIVIFTRARRIIQKKSP